MKYLICIFYSFWKGKYIFGGQFVWSSAQFKITHEIKNPHHRVTIGFYILYGKNFPSDGKFIYTFEQNQAIIKSMESADISNDDETKSERMKFIEIHSSNTLTLYWECSGNNNNPQNAYCGLYGYNVVVHYCQPNCLQCLDYNSCILWDIENLYKYQLIARLNQNIVQKKHVQLRNIITSRNKNVYLVLHHVLLVYLRKIV